MLLLLEIRSDDRLLSTRRPFIRGFFFLIFHILYRDNVGNFLLPSPTSSPDIYIYTSIYVIIIKKKVPRQRAVISYFIAHCARIPLARRGGDNRRARTPVSTSVVHLYNIVKVIVVNTARRMFLWLFEYGFFFYFLRSGSITTIDRWCFPLENKTNTENVVCPSSCRCRLIRFDVPDSCRFFYFSFEFYCFIIDYSIYHVRGGSIRTVSGIN